MRWNGDTDFLNLHKSFWVDPGNKDESSNICWKFIRYQDHLSCFPIYQCEMEGWGEKSTGYCYSATDLLSLKKSFAEAWERLWFQKYNQNKKLISSNGFAAGADSAMAIQKSREELIERQVLLEAWSTRSGWKKMPIKSARSKFLAFGMRLLGWKTTIYNIQSNIGIVKVGLVRHQDFGAYLDTTFCDNESEAEQKIIFSLFKYILIFKKSGKILDTLDFSAPEDHLRFYANPKNLRAFDFLDQSSAKRTSSIYIPNVDSICSELIVSAGEFPAVAYSYNPKWKVFCWGQNSIQGVNPWPQPLG